jgi:hypothetical protein
VNDVLACPVCGCSEMENGDYSICDVCSWENDPVQLADAEYAGGANKVSLNEARALWHAGKPIK